MGKGKDRQTSIFFYQLSEQIFVILDGYEETTEKILLSSVNN